MEEKKEEIKDEKKKGCICSLCCLIKKCIVIFVPGIIIALILFVIIEAALVPTSKPKFCGKCHEMDEVYASWKKSPHAVNRTGVEVGCIECHLPPKDKFFSHLTAKAYTGAKDSLLHIVGADYDAKEVRKKVREHMTNEVCLKCHSKIKDNQFDKDIADFHDEMVFNPEEGTEPAKCIECHADSAHVRDDDDEDEDE
ncbi:MAG: hypothetical protein FVQ82_10795 [Planctomycetes bacterium]|nr:hypothetical protein [Planctomycetota bacterium]